MILLICIGQENSKFDILSLNFCRIAQKQLDKEFTVFICTKEDLCVGELLKKFKEFNFKIVIIIDTVYLKARGRDLKIIILDQNQIEKFIIENSLSTHTLSITFLTDILLFLGVKYIILIGLNIQFFNEIFEKLNSLVNILNVFKV